MTTLRTHLAALAVVVAAALPAAVRAEPFRIVVNAAVKESALSREELSRIFLKKVTSWPGGKEIRPVEPRNDSPVRVAFSREVHRQSPDALRSYWSQMIFSGRDVPPVEKGTDDQIVAYVREHPGAIGYVSAATDTSGTKVLDVRP